MIIYGFGSYFSSADTYRDIDLLIVHNSTSTSSFLKAINIKKAMLKGIDDASVTILSKSSAEDFDFVNVSKAVPLGTVDEGETEPPIEVIIQKIKRFRQT